MSVALQQFSKPDLPEFPFTEFTPIPGTKWGCAKVTITPELAEYLLEFNDDNRKLRKSAFTKYAAIMNEGDWMTTPESIIFSDKQRLIQGQHRLHGIIKSETTQDFLVMVNVEDEVFKALDRGAIRTAADALNLPKKLSEVGKILAVLQLGDTKGTSTSITDATIFAMSTLMEEIHEELLERCGNTTKVFSTAPFRTAACVRIMQGVDPEYVYDTYRALILNDFENLSTTAGTTLKYYINSGLSTKGVEQKVTLARAWNAFDPNKRDLTRSVVSSNGREIAEIRQVVADALKAQVGED